MREVIFYLFVPALAILIVYFGERITDRENLDTKMPVVILTVSVMSVILIVFDFVFCFLGL